MLTTTTSESLTAGTTGEPSSSAATPLAPARSVPVTITPDGLSNAAQRIAVLPTVVPRQPKRRFTRGRLLLLFVLLALGALAARMLRPVPLEVELGSAAVRPMRVTVDADAVTRVRSRFTIAAPVSGLVERITLVEGDSVRAGDVVAVINSPPADPTGQRIADARVIAARAALAQAAARVRQASASLQQSERDLVRARALVAAGALAERDLETARLATETRRGDLTVATGQSRAAAAELAQASATAAAAAGVRGVATSVRAPASGRVLRIPEKSARVVAPGTPIIELGDPSSLEVVADVLSSDATAIRAGQRVELRGWGGDPLPARVRLVEPAARTRISALGVEEQRLSVLIDLVTPPHTLGDGYRLEASTTVWEHSGVLAVPASALVRDGAEWRVFTVVDGRARSVRVEIGHVGGGLAEITRGLTAGNRVVLFPSDAVKDGARVTGSK